MWKFVFLSDPNTMSLAACIGRLRQAGRAILLEGLSLASVAVFLSACSGPAATPTVAPTSTFTAIPTATPPPTATP